MDNYIEIVKDMQEVMAQMRLDDIEYDPNSEFELFSCSCCAMDKPKAGSIMYTMDIILCNDCSLLSETAFAMKKISDISEFMAQMEDKKLQNLCEYVKQEQTRLNN